MVSSNFPNRPFRLEESCPVGAQNAWNTGNNSRVDSRLWINKNSYSPTYSLDNSSSYNMYINSTLVGAANFSYDFRNSDSLLIHASNNWFSHDSEGHRYVQIDGYAWVAIMGNTEVHSGYWAPRIAQPAAAPTPYPSLAESLDEITTNSMRYRFAGGDLRGGTLTRWEYQYADNPSFTGAVTVTSSGTSTQSGLTPGKTYYFRSRAVTNAGNGAWSATSSAMTLAAVYYSDGDSWEPVEVYYSDGINWLAAEVLYSNGTAWVSPLSL